MKLKFSVKYFIRKCKQTRECIKSYFTLSVFYQLKIRVAVIQEPLNLFGMQHCVKSIRIQSFSGPYFLVFGLHTERYSVSLRMQSKCEKIRTKKTPNTVTFHAMQINWLLSMWWQYYPLFVWDLLQSFIINSVNLI